MELKAKHLMYVFWVYHYLFVVLDYVVLYVISDFVFYGMAIFGNAFLILLWFLANAKESSYLPKPYF